MKIFEIGGCIRDEILGIRSNDIDFSVVLEDFDYDNYDPFEHMSDELAEQGFKIFLETPEFFTVRAQFPKGHKHSRMTADFVLARKDGVYTDGRRPDSVIPGTLLDDQGRRDFRMNSIAKDENGKYIDPFNGQADIENMIIRAVGDPLQRLTEDALRAVRALRFSVTKGFDIDEDLYDAMGTYQVAGLVELVSDDRIAVELSKMFRFDTLASLDALRKFPVLTSAIFSGSVSLDSTMKLKGRG